jgi:hypothetical protein
MDDVITAITPFLADAGDMQDDAAVTL